MHPSSELICHLQCIGQPRNVFESNEKFEIFVIEETPEYDVISLQRYEISVLYTIWFFSKQLQYITL